MNGRHGGDDSPAPPAPRRGMGWLPPGSQLTYAGGAFGFNVFHQTISLWLVYFYAPPPESGRETIVPIAIFGALLAAGEVIEAFDDPVIGHWSDRTRSRWGRRLPFILGGLPFLVGAFILLFTPLPPGFWPAVAAFVVIQLYHLAGTIVHQPYEAVLAEMARSSEERVRVSSWKVAFGILGAAVGLVGSGLLIGALGFPGMAMVLGLLGGASVAISAAGVRRLPQTPPHNRPLSLPESLRLTATNHQYLVFVVSEVLFFAGLDMLTALIPYLVTVVLGLPESQTVWFTAVFIVVALVSLPAVNWLAARRGKAFTYRLAMTVLAVALPGLFFVGAIPGIDRMLQSVAYIGALGVPMSVLFALPNPMVANIVDYDETRTGLRREGAYYGVEEFVMSLGLALATLVFSSVLGTFGFSAGEPLGIRLIGPVAGLAVAAGLLVFARWYRLPEQIPSGRLTFGTESP